MFSFLAYFTLYNRLQFHPSHQNWFKWTLFYGWKILHCVYVPQLSYPFVCRWTSRLLPCPGYCKQCCDEHWSTRVSFSSGFLSVYAQKWYCWVVFATSSKYLLLLLGPYHFCPLLSPTLHEISLGISDFLDEISSLSHSIVFLYFFALITKEGLPISPWYSLELLS